VGGVEQRAHPHRRLRLDLGALGDLVAHAHEDVGDPLGELRQRVAAAARVPVGGQRDVDCLLREDPLVALRGQHRVALVVGGLDPLAGLVDALPGVGLRLWGSAPISRRATSTGERSRTQVGRLERGERLERAGAGEGRRGVGARGVEGLRVEGGDLLGVVESLVPDIAALELLTRSSRS